MKAISLWQPWATLIAVEAKRIETRHWAAPRALLGQRIAIHAAKTNRHVDLRHEHPFGRYLATVGELPLGAIVATAVLARCAQMNELGIAELQATLPDEHAFGLYEIGRWAWVLNDIVRIDEPIPWRGSQGFFDVPDEALGVEPPQGALL